MTPQILIVAVSGRALAAAARRAGTAPLVLDLFNDLDTRALASRSAACGSLAKGFDAEALLAAARAEPGLPLVYGSGFEARPGLLARLAEGRTLFGNPPETVARIKDPAVFFPLLDRLGIPHPAVALAPPKQDRDWPAGWLVKRTGGAGGAHVRPARKRDRGAGHYFQRRVEGESVSALFLANGRAALVLGYSVQWRAPGPKGVRRPGSFLFGGAARPARIARALARRIEDFLPRLVAETGLLGLNSADFLLRDEGFDLLEINPRPGATLDIFDRLGAPKEGRGLFALHLAACQGDLPEAWQPLSGAAASAVVYTPRELIVPQGLQWPDWAADLPEDGSTIPAGAPLCTVLAEAADVEAARRLVAQRGEQILQWIEQPVRASVALPGAA